MVMGLPGDIYGGKKDEYVLYKAGEGTLDSWYIFLGVKSVQTEKCFDSCTD